MAGQVSGRISETDRERVRDASRIDAVVGDYVALKRAGSGNLKGLCPFHDEKTPSFTVSVPRGFYHCFGCGEGGDVFDFLMKIDQLSYVEAVQYLADKAGITLSYVAGGQHSGPGRGSRSRLVAVTAAAAAFYAQRLADDEAAAARSYLADRGFDEQAAVHFGCGFAPSGWDTLITHLAKQGFSIDEMRAAGVAKQGARGPIDQFHRRLTWAIKDAFGDVVGFGARRLFDDDRLEAKYVNTSGDGRLYRKSQVLYGLDLAKRDIARERQVVVVEGYTDVMAMHAAGVTTAVAACGTAFGEGHIGVLRRYLMDSELIRGEVIYVFDGDEAGQKAALKAFDSDQKFAANTYVAVAPDGMDPCELRQEKGDAALRELVRSRTALFRFAITQTLDGYDLETVEGRTSALAEAVPMVARIKDDTTRTGYVRELANRVGVDARDVGSRVRAERRRAATARRTGGQARRPTEGARDRRGDDRRDAADRRGDDHRDVTDRRGADGGRSTDGQSGAPTADGAGPGGAASSSSSSSSSPSSPDSPPSPSSPRSPSAPGPAMRRPNPTDPNSVVERETLKLALQFPALVAPGYGQVERDAFAEPAYAAIHDAIMGAGGPAGQSGAAWIDTVATRVPDGPLRSLVTELTVEGLQQQAAEPGHRYAGAILARMAERVAAQQERDLVSALRRAEAAGDKQRASSLGADLANITAYRRALSDRARGAE